MRFKPECAKHSRLALRNRVNLTRIAHSLRNQFTAALLWNADIPFLKCLGINIREIDIVELHAAQLFELLFHSPSHLKGYSDDFLKLLLCVLSVRIEKLNKSANHLSNGNRVALIEVFAKTEILVQRITILFFSQLTDKL